MRKPDLVLINPPHPTLVNPHAQVPLGLLTLAAVAEADGLDVQHLNMTNAGRDSDTWAIHDAACYGITGTCFDVPAVRAVAAHCKRWSPRARVIVGGPISLSLDALDSPHIDHVVQGEGESVIVGLVRTGAATRVVLGEPADMAALPMPARHLWPGPFGGNVFIGGENYFGGGTATIMSTRGCPFSCAFCAGPALSSRTVRFKPPERFVAEMEQCVTDFGVRQFRLSDEFFTCKRSHVQTVCGLIRKSAVLGRGNGIAWRASIGVKPHGLDLFRDMATAGCKEVAFGVETADPAVLSKIARKGSPADASEALTNARAAGLKTRALLMVGLPGTTTCTGARNAAFLRSGLFDSVAVTIFTPLPGCAIYQEPERFGVQIRTDLKRDTVCAYGPDGRNLIEPTIDMLTISRDDLRAQMRDTIELAESIGKIGKGAA